MRWYSIFLGHRDSNSLLDEDFCNVWICSPSYGANINDDFAMFCAGGEPWPHD